MSYYCFLQPALNRFDNYRWQIEFSADVLITKGFLLSAAYVYSHENVIVKGLKNDDRILTYGLTYQFQHKKRLVE